MSIFLALLMYFEARQRMRNFVSRMRRFPKRHASFSVEVVEETD